MDHLESVAPYKPTGDQQQALDAIAKGVKGCNQFQTLLCDTGSGKTFTTANVIEKFNRKIHQFSTLNVLS